MALLCVNKTVKGNNCYMYALVTGASSGIGEQIALLLAEKGYNLILTARRVEKLTALQKSITEKYSVNVITMFADLSKKEEVQNLHEKCKAYNITVLINNAGLGKIGFLSQTEQKDESFMIDTNITALYLLTKLFIKSMEKGHILNVSSIAAFQPDPKMAVYGATKSFVLNFSLAAGYELKKENKPLYISVLCPGPVNTEFNDVAGGSFGLKAMSAQKCARIAVKGMFKKKRVIIPGVLMKTVRLLSRFAPLALLLKTTYNIQDNKQQKNK